MEKVQTVKNIFKKIRFSDTVDFCELMDMSFNRTHKLLERAHGLADSYPKFPTTLFEFCDAECVYAEHDDDSRIGFYWQYAGVPGTKMWNEAHLAAEIREMDDHEYAEALADRLTCEHYEAYLMDIAQLVHVRLPNGNPAVSDYGVLIDRDGWAINDDDLLCTPDIEFDLRGHEFLVHLMRHPDAVVVLEDPKTCIYPSKCTIGVTPADELVIVYWD